jgi:hypothetical protein
VDFSSFGVTGLRRIKCVKIYELRRTNATPIVACHSPDQSPLAILTFEPVLELQFPHKLQESLNCDILYHAGYFSHSSQSPRRNWFGFMHVLSIGSHPQPADIFILPIIDLNLSDRNCIY